VRGATQSISSRIRQHPGRIRDVLLSFTGILLFAGFIHQPFPLLLLAIGGLACTAVVIGFSIRHLTVLEAFGLNRLNQKILLYVLPAIVLGLVLGILTRSRFELTLIPVGFTSVAIVAPLVGSFEELVFRGYIQGQLRAVGKIFSIITASALHTTYKLLVILTLAVPLQFDFFFLIFWTFVGGVLIGTLRELSGNTIPPVIAHAVFDIVLYGELVSAPVWVWS
jgi:membrane protease YdiL (CAAX protease family)